MSEFKELSGKCRGASKGLQQAANSAVAKLAEVAKRDQLAAARATGVGGTVAGKRVGVNYKLRQGTPASALVRWTGPAHLVNNPTKAHDIYPRKYAGTRGTGKKAQKGATLLSAFGVDARASGAIVLADGNVRAHVRHPGTRGKHFFQTAAKISHLQGSRVVRNEVVRSLAQHFTGG